MLDNELIALFRGIIIAGLTARGLANVAVKQAYQPTQQGANSTPTVYFFKLFDHSYGFLKREDKWDPETETEIRTQTQQYESTFQVEALVTQKPDDVLGLTASDLVKIVAEILGSEDTVTELNAAGIGIYRITDIRNPNFVSDKDQSQAAPSFDFVLTHESTNVTIVPTVDVIKSGIYPV